MKYAGIIKNDFSAAPGISVTFFTQGCPHRCEKCHNPETWDYNGGIEFTADALNEILSAIMANGIKRSLTIMGGEPLCPENVFLTLMVIKTVKEKYPDVDVYLWTGYYFNEIPKTPHTEEILTYTKCIIDGPYVDSLRDVTLKMRGSSNQNIIYLDK